MADRQMFGKPAKTVPNRTDFRPIGVNRYEVQGVTYTYYRPSRARLPNLPLNDPDFIEAYDRAVFAHETGTESYERWGQIEEARQVDKADFKLAKKPDAVGFSVPDIIRFVLSAERDQVMIYHIGNLAIDGVTNPVVRDKQRYAMLAADFHALSLQQSKIGPGIYQYYALRTPEPLRGLPQHAIQGRITPDEYTALTAINERQASLSVSRVIRDTLSITDIEAGAWRGNMIDRGWLTNGRPPELTALGLSLLS